MAAMCAGCRCCICWRISPSGRAWATRRRAAWVRCAGFRRRNPVMADLPDYLPLSFLNQLVYCPRRFWLMYVESEMLVNAPVLEGMLRHQRAHTPGQMRDQAGRVI